MYFFSRCCLYTVNFTDNLLVFSFFFAVAALARAIFRGEFYGFGRNVAYWIVGWNVQVFPLFLLSLVRAVP